MARTIKPLSETTENEQRKHEAAKLARIGDLLFSTPSVLLSVIAAVMLSIFLGFYLWADNLEAKFGFLDDHQVATWLGPGNSITYADAKQIFRGSEALFPGSQQRYRPVYFLIRVAEAYLWGGDAKLWYSARIAMFVISSTIMGFLTIRYFGVLIGSLITAIIWTASYWSAIWSLLGPAESYACVGVSLYLLSVFLLFSTLASSRVQDASIFILVIGSVLASGSKENFAGLFIPTLITTIALVRTRRITVGQVSLLVASMAFNVFILGAVMKGTAAAGRDIYEQSVSSSRVSNVIKLVNGSDPFLLVLCAFGVISYWIYKKSVVPGNNLSSDLGARLVAPGIVIGVLCALYASQLVFYNGSWDPASRYAFPGELLFWGGWMVIGYLLLRELEARLALQARSLQKTVSFLLVALLFWFGFDSNRAFAAANRERTAKIQRAIDRSADALRRDPASFLVLYSATLNDYEAIFALKVYLNNKGLEKRVMLEMATPYASQDWPKDLAAAILPHMQQATQGKLGGFIPLILDSPDRRCFRLAFSGTPPKDSCSSLGFVLD